MVRTLCFHCQGAGLAPGGEIKIPQDPSQLCGKKRKKKKKITESSRKCQERLVDTLRPSHLIWSHCPPVPQDVMG